MTGDGAPAVEGKKYLVFSVGAFSLAMAIESIRRVHDAGGTPPRIPGSRVIDLHEITGARAERSPGYWIEMDPGGGRYLVPVEDVEEIRELSLAIPMEYPASLRSPETACFRRLYFDGLRMMVEVDAAALTESCEPEPAPEPRAVPAAAGGREILFEAAGEHYRLDLSLMVQIVGGDDVYAVPSGKSGIRGVIYYLDRAAPVLGPELLTAENSGARPGFDTVILIETSRGLIGLGCGRIIKVGRREEIDEIIRTGGHKAHPVDPVVLLTRLQEGTGG